MIAILAITNIITVVLLPAVILAGVIFFLYSRKLVSSHTVYRKEEMRVLALRINFQFNAKDVLGVRERIEAEKRFFYNNNGSVENLIYGQKNGIDVVLFDYCYSDLQKQSLTVCMLTVPSTVKAFTLEPLDDNEMESGKAAEDESIFGGKYRVDCQDRAFAERAFNDDLADFLARRRRTTVLAQGNTMIFHRDKLLSTRSSFSILDFAFGFHAKTEPVIRPAGK